MTERDTRPIVQADGVGRWLVPIDPRVRRVFLASAVLVVLIRLLGPFPVGWDQGAQLEASHRLVNGFGLTSTFFAKPATDINVDPTPKYLTHFPPGFSLVVALGLRLGIPLVVFLKLVYSTVTVAGWAAWATLAGHALKGPLRIGGRSLSFQYLLAAALPLFITPRWSGTDIFLWTAVPLMLILAHRATVSTRIDARAIASVGIVAGFAIAIRYTSLLTLILGPFVLFQVFGQSVRRYARSLTLFAASSFLVVVWILAYNQGADGFWGLPDFVGASYEATTLGGAIARIGHSLSSVTVLFGYRPSQMLVLTLRELPTVNVIYGCVCLVVLVSLPFLVGRTSRLAGIEWRHDILVSLALVQCAVVAFLMAMMSSPHTDWLGHFRYYVPASPAGVLILYGLLFRWEQVEASATRVVTGGLVAFLVMSVALAGVVVFPLVNHESVEILGRQVRKRDLVQPVLGFSPGSYPDRYVDYPSNGTVAPFRDSFLKLKQLQLENPEALFYVAAGYPYFVFDGYDRFRRVPEQDYWSEASAASDVTTYWLVRQSCPTVCLEDSGGRLAIDEPLFHDCSQTPWSFEHERTKIVECRVLGRDRLSRGVS